MALLCSFYRKRAHEHRKTGYQESVQAGVSDHSLNVQQHFFVRARAK